MTNNDELSYFELTFLTFQAVFQTVIICFLGYVAARKGILTPTVQRHISTLNVQLFTPCLIFSKLASSLSLKALVDIAIIPVFFIATTLVSLGCSRFVSRLFRLNVGERNFVTAMAVFGNSNSLPVSLTVALAYTLPNLTWPDLGNDNQDDVASRGILYLLVFQQLGQILRWSWGYNTLLAKGQDNKQHAYNPEEEPDVEQQPLIGNNRDDDEEGEQFGGNPQGASCSSANANAGGSNQGNNEDVEPHEPHRYHSISQKRSDHQISTTAVSSNTSTDSLINLMQRRSSFFSHMGDNNSNGDLGRSSSMLNKLCKKLANVYQRVMAFMNVPLWSMLVSIIVASIPPVKQELFENNGFLQRTITKAIDQLGAVAIPMILVVLGSNLAPNNESVPSANYHKIVIASLLSRMILPSVIILPLVALSVKFIQISILDDPIFLLVAFILTIAPPAIQLSQICQLNQVFEKEMAGVLFWGYVVMTLPSTIFIVVSSLEVLEWAGTTVS